jgi:hypothetical protein
METEENENAYEGNNVINNENAYEDNNVINNEKSLLENAVIDDKKENKKKKIGNIVSHIVAIICIALFCMAIAPKTLQNDTFYTIRIGEYIFNNGVSDLTTDLYSWHELPYTYPHWLYDLCIFIIYNSFGQAGIYASTMIFSAILGISVYILCNKKSKNKIVSFALTIGAIYLMRDFIAARAQLVTFILFVWSVYNIEKFLETKHKRNAIMLIIIPLLIANLHCAVFPFYFVLFMPYIGEYLLVTIVDWDLDLRLYKLFVSIRKRLSKKSDKVEKCENKIEKIKDAISERKRKRIILREKPYKIKVQKNYVVLLLIAIMIIAAFTGILNPAGDGAYTYLYKTMQGNTTSSINEHLPLTLSESKEFAIALVCFLLVLIFTDTKIKLSDLFMLGGITFLAFKSRRQVSMFAIFCIPILANLISQMVDKYDKETFKKLEKFISGAFGAFVVICLFFIWSMNIIKPHFRANYIDTSTYPVAASDWILSNLDVQNIKLYNEYNYGSYLLFRGIPVFIDSRCDLYSPEFNEDLENGIEGRDIFSDALNIAGISVNYENKFNEYGVTHIILYENSKLAMILEDDNNYKLLYNEGNFKIFERLSAVENN